MKSHDEMFQSVLSRFDEYQEKRKKRLCFIKRSAPVAGCFGLAVAFGIGYYAKFAKMPEIPVAPPVAEVSIAETTTTMVSSLTDSSTVSPSDTPKSKNTNKKTIPTTVSGHEEQTEQPPSYEVYPPRLTVTTALNTSSGSKTVHTTVSHKVTEKVSTVTTAEQTSKRTTTVETTAHTTFVSEQSTDAPIPEITTAATTAAVTTITLSPARKTVKEYSIIFSAEMAFDYDSLLDKSYAEFIYSRKDEIEASFPDDAALEEVEQAEARSGGRYPRQRAVILGEIPSYAQRLTYDGFMEILHDPNVLYSGYDYGKMKRALEEIQPYPDFVCEGEHSFTEYWLNSEGTEKIVLIPERDAAVYAVLDD